MRIHIGGGIAPRLGHRPLVRPVPRVMLLTSGDGVIASAAQDGSEILTFDLAGHPLHAGRYQIDPASLADGPACLVPPRIGPYRDGDASLRAQPGLWACLERGGTPEIQGQWLRDEQVVAGHGSLNFALTPPLSDAIFTYVETARQSGRAILSASAPLILSIEEPTATELHLVPMADATLQATLADTGTVTIRIAAPAAYAGSYQVDPADLVHGPVALVPPVIALSDDETAFLIRTPGLWIYDPDAGDLTLEHQWQRDGSPVEDAMQPDLTTRTTAIATVNLIERAVQANGQRQILSNDLLHDWAAPRLDSFAMAADTALAAYRGLSGDAWTNLTGTGNIMIRAATGRTEPNGATVFIRGAARHGARQFAEADLRHGDIYATGGTVSGIGIAVCATTHTENPTTSDCYGLTWADGVGKFRLVRSVGGSGALLAEHVPTDPDWVAGARGRIRLEYDQGTLRAWFRGKLIMTAQDGNLADGGAGLLSDASAASGRLSEALSFKGGSL